MQHELWQRLQTLVNAGKLPHALLLIGASNPANQALVQDFAEGLLCERAQAGRACTHCKSCHLLAAHTHPDYHRLSSTTKSVTIGIDAVRELVALCEQTPQCADKKIIIIFDAEHLNINASNALLKTLEEPAGNAYFILTTKTPEALPATVRSRCQALNFPNAMISAPLWQQEFYSDCDALFLHRADPLVLAKKWQTHSLLEVLEQLELYLSQKIEQSLEKNRFKSLDHVYHLRKIAMQHATVNPQLQLEALLIALYNDFS